MKKRDKLQNKQSFSFFEKKKIYIYKKEESQDAVTAQGLLSNKSNSGVCE